MTLSADAFARFTIPDKEDKYFLDIPAVRLDDLLPRHDGEIKLSLMISTYNRRAQLIRTLETLCRQTFREFEVLLNDDGSTQDLRAVVDAFSPYLNIQFFQPVKTEWRSCPSKAFRAMLPFSKGDVIAISHPEIMIDFDGIGFLYDAIVRPEIVDAYNYVVEGYKDGDPVPETAIAGKYRWSELRPAFVDEEHYHLLDETDWHSGLVNIRRMPDFWNYGGFSGRSNIDTFHKLVFPWWFVGAAHKDCPIWRDLPEFLGHGIIDMWMCGYRSMNRFVDVISKGVMCYHQPHVTMAIAPDGEDKDTSRYARKIE